MPALSTQIDIKNLKKKIALTSRNSLAQPMWASARRIKQQINTNFDAQVNPQGEKWADLKPATWARKQTRKILTETGALRRSIQVIGSKKGIEFNAGSKYAPFHHYGTSKMPKRNFFPTYKHDFPTKWLEWVREFTLKYIRAKGRS